MEVRLKVAYNMSYMTFSWTVLEVKVKNISFNKNVDLFYYHHVTGNWQQSAMVLNGHYGDYDLFKAENVANLYQFAVRYQAGGMEFWDNNQGNNYDLGSAYPGVVGGHVVLDKATAVRWMEPVGYTAFDVGWFEGDILVTNLSYNKKVGVVYSIDDGAHWNIALASYSGKIREDAVNFSGIEKWHFETGRLNINIAPSSAAYQFAVFYEDVNSGKTYWDNNFNQNYALSKTAGSQIG